MSAVMSVVSVAATALIRVSLERMCASSCARTPRSSRSSRVRSRPVVQHRAARRGVLPVAKALGERTGDR
ncbi:hypothetical protein GCM10009642_33220 [Nocardiopsis metallicus]